MAVVSGGLHQRKLWFPGSLLVIFYLIYASLWKAFVEICVDIFQELLIVSGNLTVNEIRENVLRKNIFLSFLFL